MFSKFTRFLAAALAPALLLCGCQTELSTATGASASTASTASAAQTPAPSGKAANASVWFFDVGQGDSELLQLPDGKAVLIDAGTSESAKGLVKLLHSIGVSKLDTIIATHPHADHIGGMRAVLQDFPVRQYVMPRIAKSDVPTTRVYTDLLQTIAKKKIKVVEAKAGVTLLSSAGYKLQLLAPGSAHPNNLNNYSAVAMATIGSKRFLFTGDAEKESEQSMLKSKADLHADVLKCGHHGSKTSTSPAFLKAVSPKQAVISCGRDNDYGFPPQAILARLKSAGVQIYRTDEQKTICATTDGQTISVRTGLPSATRT